MRMRARCMQQACQVVCSPLSINSAGQMLTVPETDLIFSLNLLHVVGVNKMCANK